MRIQADYCQTCRKIFFSLVPDELPVYFRGMRGVTSAEFSRVALIVEIIQFEQFFIFAKDSFNLGQEELNDVCLGLPCFLPRFF